MIVAYRALSKSIAKLLFEGLFSVLGRCLLSQISQVFKEILLFSKIITNAFPVWVKKLTQSGSLLRLRWADNAVVPLAWTIHSGEHDEFWLTLVHLLDLLESVVVLERDWKTFLE
jgi:hypothetical protein